LLQEELAKTAGGGLFTTGMLDATTKSLDDFDKCGHEHGETSVLFFEPPSLDARITNQSAVFSVISGAANSLNTWLQAHSDLYRKVVIPANLKWLVRDHLDQANVTERVLFPGLDGLSRWLGRYYGERPALNYSRPPAGPEEESPDWGPRITGDDGTV